MERERLWGGIDAGVHSSRLVLVDDQLRPVLDVILSSSAQAFIDALEPFRDSEICEIALEAGVATALLRDLQKGGLPVSALETFKASRYLRIRRNKTDRNDALGLAEMAKLQLPSVSKVHLKSVAIQQLRSKLMLRQRLIKQRVASENMLRSLIRLNGGECALQFKSSNAQQTLKIEIEKLKRDSGIDLSDEVTPLLDLCRSMRKYLGGLEKQLESWARAHAVCRRFLAIPGVGPICAISFYSAIEDPSRFPKAVDIGAYLGLAPRISQSGLLMRHGRISRMGNKLTRSHLSLAAASVLAERTSDSPLKRWGLRVAERSGRRRARIAVARRLAVIMLAMWRDDLPYRPEMAEPRTRPKLYLLPA